LIQLLLPEIILVIVALLLPGLGFLVKKNRRFLGYFALIGLVIALVITLDMLGLGLSNALGLDIWNVQRELYDLRLNIDTFALFFHLIFLSIAILVVLTSISYVKEDEPHQGEFYSLLILAVLGMMFLSAATDIFVLYLGLELAAVSSYAMVAFRKNDKKSSESALKFFIIGAASSAIILFAISLLYGVVSQSTGVQDITNLVVLGQGISTGLISFEPALILAIVFLIAGFGFKVAIVPFHMWAPDVYEGAPTPVAAFLAAGSKKMGVVAFFKIFLVGLIAAKTDWVLIIGILAVVTMTVGNVMAIPQRNIKRMLAYSSIAQAGYIMIALAVAGGTYSVGSPEIAQYGLAGGMYHILTHVFMKGGAFIVVAMVFILMGTEDIMDYKGLYKRYPLVALCMAIFLLSLVGLPPFGGFFSKFVLFSSAVNASGWYIWLAVAGVLNSALSLYYYARVLRFMYSSEGVDVKETEKKKLPRALAAAMVIAAIMVVLSFVLAEFIISTGLEGAGGLLP
jgi:NADH-quinone oxidoreductase subunit N